MKIEQTTSDPGKRKLWLVLPVFVLPFLTLGFWALGGGSQNKMNSHEPAMGLNLQLPNAQLRDDWRETKLGYYEEAEKDSVRRRQTMQKDRFWEAMEGDTLPAKDYPYDPYPLKAGTYKDPNEQKVYEKLAELDRRMHYRDSGPVKKESSHLADPNRSSLDRDEVSRLEEMMKTVNTPGARDPEVEQLSSMMDKVLDIQHPDRVKERTRQKANREAIFAVRASDNELPVSWLHGEKDTLHPKTTNGFYDGGGTKEDEPDQGNAIPAVVQESATILQGSVIKLRLLRDIYVHNTRVPRGSFVFGTTSLENERLSVHVPSIRSGNNILPVQLTAFDLDGLEGIFIPGSLTKGASKESADRIVQSVQLTPVDPSIKAQATSAGIQSLKGILSKKVRVVRVTVKAGYQVLLKDGSKLNN